MVSPIRIRNLSEIFKKVNFAVSDFVGFDFFLSLLLDASIYIARRSRRRSKNSGITRVIVATELNVYPEVEDDKAARSGFFSKFDGDWRNRGNKQHKPERKQMST